MQPISDATLFDAFAAWGAHEAIGRGKGKFLVDVSSKISCAMFILASRAPLIARILSLEPQETVLVEFEPSDAEAMALFDGRRIEQWIEKVVSDQGVELQHFRSLVDAVDGPKGPLIAVAQLPAPAASAIGPIILYDGWHRVAAWYERSRFGKSQPISAYLIMTAK